MRGIFIKIHGGNQNIVQQFTWKLKGKLLGN